MHAIEKIWLNDKQKKLIQLAFSDAPEKGEFDFWRDQYSVQDLDFKTRAILPFLIKNFEKMGAPNNLLPEFCYRYYQSTWLANLKKFDYFFKLLKIFNKAEIDVCLLKGASMLLFFYKSMGMRPENSDIDLLLKTTDIKKAVEKLKALGFKPYGRASEFIDQAMMLSDAFPKTYFHAITLVKGNFFIDLHWRHMKFSCEPSFDVCQGEMKQIFLRDARVYLLSLEQQFIHICVHGLSDTSKELNFFWLLDALFLLQNYKAELNAERLTYWANRYQAGFFIEVFFNFSENLVPGMAQNLSLRQARFRKTSVIKRFFYQLQLVNHHFIRSIGFYCSIYAAFFSSGKFSNQVFGVKEFIRYYFGLNKNEGTLKFFLKGFFIKLSRKT